MLPLPFSDTFDRYRKSKNRIAASLTVSLRFHFTPLAYVITVQIPFLR